MNTFLFFLETEISFEDIVNTFKTPLFLGEGEEEIVKIEHCKSAQRIKNTLKTTIE